MKIYVAGSLEDVRKVREVQDAAVSAGHELVLDWTRGPDAAMVDYRGHREAAAQLAKDDLDAVIEAEAVLLVVSGKAGRGMYVEFGAALLRAEQGSLDHVVVIGPGDESVFFFHPAVHRCSTVQEWLASLT